MKGAIDKKELRAKRQYLQAENKKWPRVLTRVPSSDWPEMMRARVEQVWRSRDFSVQMFAEAGGVVRLSINRTALDSIGGWQEGITWDELQRIKAECGFGDCEAVEVFPRERDVVNVANMRHLWILPELLAFSWRNGR